MDILTRDFGSISINPHDIIEFVQPIFGFDDYTKYVILCDEEIGSHFAWLQSVEDPELCFLLADPNLVHPSYAASLPPETHKALGDGTPGDGTPGESEGYEYWAMMVVPENFSEATVNLKSPVIINTQTHQAAQVILDLDYPIRCPLTGKGKDEASC